MKITNKEISEQFSQGNFPFCYEHFSDTIQWNIIGTDCIRDKQNVIAFCNKMMTEMASSTLTNTNIISAGDHVAIEGFCNYTDVNNNPCKVSYCDVYHFDDDKVSGITSYCIDKKL